MASIEMFLIVVLSSFSIVCGNVPVLLWESSKSDRVNYFPALHRITNEEFQQYILKKLHGEQPAPLIVFFAEESLSLEDFSWKDSEGQGYFPQLKYVTENAANFEFQPSVQNPIQAVQKLSEFGYASENVEDKEAYELPDGCGKILVVKLPEAQSDEDRPDLLRRHDTNINEIYSQLLSKCSHVVGILSGEQTSWVEPDEVSRFRRNTERVNEASPTNNSLNVGPSSAIVYSENRSLLYSTSVPKLMIDGKQVNISEMPPSVTGDLSKGTELKLVVKYGSDHRLTFNFDNKTWAGYWFLRSVHYDFLQKGTSNNITSVILKTSSDIVAPLAKSYHSGSTVTFFNRSMTSSLTFSDLQVQPFFLNPGATAFASAIDAVEFFTPAIWSGIFVTFLLALIFTWGLSMIMDIRTMDQFDDPKGKTITITATD